MTYSMTAFARVQKQLDSGNFSWEIRSVNHRYLDVSFRLPEAFRFLETSLRSMIREQVSRGKLECQLKFQSITSDNQSLQINEGLVNGLIEMANHLAASKHLANDLSLTTILGWPEVLQPRETDVEAQAMQAADLFQEAMTELVAQRKTEGQALSVLINNRLDQLSLEVKTAKQESFLYSTGAKDRLAARLKVLQLEIDNTRLEQEIALLLARWDVSEELDRLQTHIVEVSKALKSPVAAGRRLDFLMQELNREANTLSSKSDSVALTQSAVEMKVLIEQMREQIQNIE